MEDFFGQYRQMLDTVLSSISASDVTTVMQVLWRAWKEESTIFICGNGGSAATASHFACDLGKGTTVDGQKRFKVIALTDNMATLSAISNDLDYSEVFLYQLENLFGKGDILIGISASGNSANVVKAFKFVKEMGGVTIGLIGFSGGRMLELSDYSVHVKNDNYGIVEDLHLVLEHAITQELRRRIISNDKTAVTHDVLAL